MRRVATVVGLSTTALLLSTGLAHADERTDTLDSIGARATCTMQSWDGLIADSEASIDCTLTDTVADKHSVYVEWWQDGYARVRLANHEGAGRTTTHQDARSNPDGSFGTLYWHVCRDVQFGRDDCSPSVVHRTDPRA